MRMTLQIEDPEVEQDLLHVMLVDDEDDYHLITRMMLKKAGFRGRFSAFLDPDEAIAHLRESHEMPDLLLVDINMPATDGFEFLSLCAHEHLLSPASTTVVMCSSSNRPMDMEMAKQSVFISEYVEKPLSPDQFNRIAEQHARRQGSGKNQ